MSTVLSAEQAWALMARALREGMPGSFYAHHGSRLVFAGDRSGVLYARAPRPTASRIRSTYGAALSDLARSYGYERLQIIDTPEDS